MGGWVGGSIRDHEIMRLFPINLSMDQYLLNKIMDFLAQERFL